MNWIVRLGEWVESRKKVSQIDFKAQNQALWKGFEELKEKVAHSNPELLKEIKLLNLRLNRMELFVGLKREEPQAVEVKGAPRIS